MIKVTSKTTARAFYNIPADSACLYHVGAGIDQLHALGHAQNLEDWVIEQLDAGVGERTLTESDLYVMEFLQQAARAIRKSLGVEV